MRDDHFTNTEADAGLYERQRAQDDYDPPDVDHDEPERPKWADLFGIDPTWGEHYDVYPFEDNFVTVECVCGGPWPCPERRG